MTKCTFFALGCKDFQTSHFSALCSSLVRSSRLQSLTLVFNGGDQFLETLIPALSKLTSLTTFFIDLSGEGSIQANNIYKLFLALSSIKTLTDITLRLDSWKVTSQDPSFEPFAEGLQHLTSSSIRKLAFEANSDSTSKHLVKISQALEKFTSLQTLTLKLSDSQIIAQGLGQLSSVFKKLGLLTSLSLTFSGYTENLALAFESLQSLVSLKLNLKDPHPSQYQNQQLISSLKALKLSLKYLQISFPQKSFLSDLMLENIAEALQELTLLKFFSLKLTSASNITSKGIEALGLAIERFSNLSCLDLNLASSNGVDEKTLSALSQTLKGLPLLYSVELDFGQCDQLNSSESALKSFLAAIGEMKKICKLRLNLPLHSGLRQEADKLKQRFDLRIYEYLNILSISTL